MEKRIYYSGKISFLPWSFLAMGLFGVFLFILLLPIIFGVMVVAGVVIGAVAVYMSWKIKKLFKMESENQLWKDDRERADYSDKPIIDITENKVMKYSQP